MHQFAESFEQINKMETFSHHDVGGVQISANTEANAESATCNDAIVCAEIVENANEIFGTTVAKIEYEND